MQAYGFNVDKLTLKRLSALSPGRTAAAIAFDWGVIVAAIAAAEYVSHPLAYVAAAFIIGGRMHGLGTLIHDFAHYRFIADKSRSEWVGDIFLAWPLFTTVDGYRQNHLAHHRYTNTDQDPDWVIKLGTRQFTFPQEFSYAIMNLAGYFVGISSVRDLRSLMSRLSAGEPAARSRRLARLAFYLLVMAVIVATGTWKGFLLYWVAPYLSVFLLVLYVRSVAEHFGSMDYEHELTSSRTVLPYWWERLFFAPHHVNYHLDHHLYPSVPFYNLPQLHTALLADPEYARSAHITRGYTTGLVRECIAESERERQAAGAPST